MGKMILDIIPKIHKKIITNGFAEGKKTIVNEEKLSIDAGFRGKLVM
jgi:hypothetical protein